MSRVYVVAVQRGGVVPGMLVPGQRPGLFLGSGAGGRVKLVASREAADEFTSFGAAEFAAGLCVGGVVLAENT